MNVFVCYNILVSGVFEIIINEQPQQLRLCFLVYTLICINIPTLPETVYNTKG